MRTVPAGITWERKGRQRWVCTIRREPEVVYGLGDLIDFNIFYNNNSTGIIHLAPPLGEGLVRSMIGNLFGGLGL